MKNEYIEAREKLAGIIKDLEGQVEQYFNLILEKKIPAVPPIEKLKDSNFYQVYFNRYSDIVQQGVELLIKCDRVGKDLSDILRDPEIRAAGQKRYIQSTLNTVKTMRYDVIQVKTVAYGRLKFLQELSYNRW